LSSHEYGNGYILWKFVLDLFFLSNFFKLVFRISFWVSRIRIVSQKYGSGSGSCYFHRIRGRTLAWIRNWLTGRKQRVVLNGKYSTWAEVLSGVPQGSVLGPILFLIFINDLDDDAMFIELLKKFADDTKLGHTATTPEDRETLQIALDNLCDWSEKWGMAFNST
jgi:hypothetical protein